MAVFAIATFIASCRPIRPLQIINMTYMPSSMAKVAAAERIHRLSSSSTHTDTNDDDDNFMNRSTIIPPLVKPLIPPKRILLLRHGQAVHNPRAEAARENGCSFDEFLRLMSEDDAFDSPLTELGEKQAITAGQKEHIRHALRDVEMVVSSPFSRALKTADLVHPPEQHASKVQPRRVCIEDFREINGKLLNAQRRSRSELEQHYPHWDFGNIPGKQFDAVVYIQYVYGDLLIYTFFLLHMSVPFTHRIR